MTALPILVLAVALFVVSLLVECLLVYLAARRKRLGSDQPDSLPPIVTGGPRAHGMVAGYTADGTGGLAKPAAHNGIDESPE
jgi:hypothetical protein